MRLLSLVLVVALLAGCAAPPTPPEGTPDPTLGGEARSAPLFDPSKTHPVEPTPAPGVVAAAFHTGLGAWEPTLGATSDGTLYVTGLQPNPTAGAAAEQAPVVLATRDRGQSFQVVSPALPTGDGMPLRTWDPYLYVDSETGRIFADDIFPIGCGMLRFTDDGGESWTTNPASCGNPNTNDHQTLVAATPRLLPALPAYPKVVYRCVQNVIPTCATSLDGGLTFRPQVPVVDAEHACGPVPGTGHLAADAEGRVFLPFPCGDSPAFATTDDDGLSWRVHIIDEGSVTDTHDVAIAPDEAGNLFALWVHDSRMVFAASGDHGETWSAPRIVPTPGVTGTWFSALAAGAKGRVALAFLGTEAPGGYEGRPEPVCEGAAGTPYVGVGPPFACTVGEGWENVTWNAYLTFSVDALDPAATFTTVAANSADDPLARGLCGGSRCHGMYDFIDITIDPEGRPWASFVDVCNEACREDPDATHDTPIGMLATILEGPSLRGAARLPTLPPPRA